MYDSFGDYVCAAGVRDFEGCIFYSVEDFYSECMHYNYLIAEC